MQTPMVYNKYSLRNCGAEVCQKLTVCKLGRCCPSRVHEGILAVFRAVSFHADSRTATVFKLRVERIL